MFQSIYVVSPVRIVYSSRAQNKKAKVKVKKLQKDSTIVMAYNAQTGVILDKKNSNIKFDPSGGVIGICALLKPESTQQSGNVYKVRIGPNTSNNSKEGYYSASLTITFQNNLPIGSSAPESWQGGLGSLWVGYIWNTDYFLDLKAMANGAQYCQIQVDLDPTNSNIALIEDNLFIHLATSSNKASNPQVIYTNESLGASQQDDGSDPEHVVNRNVFIDLSTEDNVFLIPLVGGSGSNPFQFEIGDPKLDAEVDVEEV